MGLQPFTEVRPLIPLDSTKTYYESHAKEYFTATIDVDLPQLWAKLSTRLKERDYILDLGCGSGRDVHYFTSRGYLVTGIDYSFNLLQLAQSRARGKLVLGEMTSLPLPCDCFDAVWAVGSLLHLTHKKLTLSLREISRVLKKEGLLVTSVKRGHGETVDKLGRYTVFFQPKEWLEHLQTHGFLTDESETVIGTRRDADGTEKTVEWIVSVSRKSKSSPTICT
jgi:ubiquinone/menaquinone biosynthesis C-methylase UbiE